MEAAVPRRRGCASRQADSFEGQAIIFCHIPKIGPLWTSRFAGVRATVMMDYCVGQEVEFQVLVDSMKERFSGAASKPLVLTILASINNLRHHKRYHVAIMSQIHASL